ncbi:hypothetical protein ACWEPB_06285 [Kitasatospora cineracea]
MNPEELHARLPEAADLADPPELDTGLLVRRVRRGRRHRRALTGGAALALSAAAVLGTVRWTGTEDPARPAASAPVGSLQGPYACGDRLPLEAGSATFSGITFSVSSVRKTDSGSAPVLEARFTADRGLNMNGQGPESLEVLYLRDGVVVGGGPLLRQPGDHGEHGEQLGTGSDHQYSLVPDVPLTVPLGTRDALCPSVRWSQVWAEPARYEAVVVLGRVWDSMAQDPEQRSAIMVARAPFPG